ncbi:hypothetical protein D3C87_1079790 [compost metagenome]
MEDALLALAVTSAADDAGAVFCSNAAAQALLVNGTRVPLLEGLRVTRTVNSMSSLWPGASARLPSVRPSAGCMGSRNGSALAAASRSQAARPVKPDAICSTPWRTLGAPTSSQAATRPSGLSMSKVQSRLSITRTFGAGAAPVLPTLKR